MSLWLALIWLVCAAICIGVFSFCRKRIADIGQQVTEEIENRVSKILTAERDAETRLLEAFTSFDNPAEAIRTYQKIQSEIFRCPQAEPPWNWTPEDMELWRKQIESEQRAHRTRPMVLATVIIIMALGIAATLTTVITLNSVPALSAQAGSVNIAGTSTGQLPPSVSVPAQVPPTASLPPLPTRYSPMPPDDTFNGIKQLSFDVNNSVQNSSDIFDTKPAGPNFNDRITGGSNSLDRTKLFIKPNLDSDISNNDDPCNGTKDIGRDVNPITNSNTTESLDPQFKGEKYE